jgi:hypothetical protein
VILFSKLLGKFSDLINEHEINFSLCGSEITSLVLKAIILKSGETG